MLQIFIIYENNKTDATPAKYPLGHAPRIPWMGLILLTKTPDMGRLVNAILAKKPPKKTGSAPVAVPKKAWGGGRCIQPSPFLWKISDFLDAVKTFWVLT